MLYNEPFVIYLNICICIKLFFLTLPTLLNGNENFKVRFAFALVLLTVITNCTTNVIVFLNNNYSLIAQVFLLFFIPLLFGPAVLYYVKGLVGKHVNKRNILSLIPRIISFGYGIILLFSSDTAKQETLNTIAMGNHHIFNITNLITLFYILFWQKLVISSKTDIGFQ